MDATATNHEPLAIIGVGCLFPGAGDFGAYWANIVNKVDGITDVPPTHWRPEDYLDADPKAPDRTYAARGGFLSPIAFNPAAYGIAPNSIEATDTSQLLGLMVAEQALADAGYAAKLDRARVGCILGVTGTLELVIPLGARLGHPVWRRALQEAGVARDVADDVVRRIGDAYVPWQESSFPGLLGNVVAGRIANRLDLGGTNCVVDAACASSLSAVHLAALELQTGRADLVITGGVDTFNDIFMYMCFSKTPALSPTGDARPFDAGGDGTILGEGLGIVVLKRLADARRDGDRVYALLRGIGASSDGKGNAVYAPKAEGQVAALRQAYRVAGVTPDTIELVEAHGTGTRVGDAAEVAGLTEVYRGAGRTGAWCALGSVKSQIGHTKAAAGAAGLLKAVAALYHKVLPPTIKVKQPLEALRAHDTPFYVNAEKRPWMPSEAHPRRAAVSAFGFGGSNFHCVVEEADPRKQEIDWDGATQILAFAAATPQGIAAQLAQWPAELPWEELRLRAARTRGVLKAEGCRLLLVVQRGRTDLAKLLAAARTLLDKNAGQKTWRGPEGIYFGGGAPEGKLAVLFPGQGAQYPGMLRDLACHFPQAHDVLTEANRHFAREPAEASHKRLSDYLYPPSAFTPDAKAAQEAALRATQVAQPALGAAGLGAWRVLEYFGVTADAAAGHSYGELTALCAAGRLDAAAFHDLSRLRGRLMGAAGEGRADPGAMLAVFAAAEMIAQVLRDENLDLVLANKNAPEQTVLSGATAAVERAATAFAARQVRTQRLAVAAAFHSPLVADAAAPFRAALEAVGLPPGAMPVYANSTAQPYPDDPAQARALLAGQLARPVEFVAEIESLYRAGVRTFLEVGPGARLTGLVDAILAERRHEAHALDASSGQRSGFYDLGCTLAWLAAQGRPVRLALWDDGERRLRDLPPENGKPNFTVQLCGANYVKPRPERPPVLAAPAPNGAHVKHETGTVLDAAPAVAAARRVEPPPPSSGVATPTMNVPDSPPPPSNPPLVAPTAPDGTALAQALQTTRESMAALQRMLEQTANLHRQFLEGQDSAQRTVHLLVEQQQRLLQAGLGLPMTPLPVPAPAPVVAAPAPPPASPLPQLVAPLPAPAPSVAAPPAQPVSPSAQLPVAPPASGAKIESILLDVIAEKTGYPAEMLELDMALDADLGIDSIKRVEILSALQERLPEAPAIKPEHLGTLHNLRQIAAFLAGAEGRANGAAPAQAVDSPRAPAAELKKNEPDTPRAPEVTLERSVVRAEALDVSQAREPVQLSEGAEILLAGDDSELAPALERRLQTLGYRPRRADLASLPAQPRPSVVGGLVVIAAHQGVDDAFLKQALFALQWAGPGLRRAGQESGAVFATVSRLDGAFGLAQLDARRELLDGGLAGLAKTVRHEWREVCCKAFDLAGDFADADDAAALLVEELFLAGPAEVGLSRAGRRTLVRTVQPLAGGPVTPPLRPGELVVVSGGARGVTAEVAVALARAYRPTLLLLGRSPAPQREPDWLAPLTSESDIKRELGRRANGDATPKRIGEQYRGVAAAREISRTLARVEAAGARAVYHGVDIRDAGAVASVLATVCQQFGPARGLVHGAGVLADARIEDKTAEQFDRVYGTKVEGLRNLLGALAADELHFLALFSSSTGRFGRAGQVDYAVANEVLNKLAQRQARLLPRCRVVSVNWGPWDGGMVTPALKKLFEQEGIGVIGLEAGADYLAREIGTPDERAVEVVVLGGGAAAPKATPAPAALPAAAPKPLPAAFERVLDLAEHPVLHAHVFDGRPVLPVVLMLEWLAHGALHQNPGLLFHGCNELRVLHGVILDEPAAPTLRIGAGRAVKRDGFFLTPVELRSVRADGREMLHARAEIVLAASLPLPPSDRPDEREVAERPYPHTPEEMYQDWLFHGPDLRGITRVEGYGERGIAGLVRGAPPPGDWIRRPLRNRWLADPLALDASFQLMILWSRQRHQAVNLPCLLTRYRQYRRAFPDDGVRVAVRVTKDSPLHALADIEYRDNQGDLVARLDGYECVIDPALRRAFRRRTAGTP